MTPPFPPLPFPRGKGPARVRCALEPEPVLAADEPRQVADQRPVRDQRAFRRAGRAARVDQHRGVVGRAVTAHADGALGRRAARPSRRRPGRRRRRRRRWSRGRRSPLGRRAGSRSRSRRRSRHGPRCRSNGTRAHRGRTASTAASRPRRAGRSRCARSRSRPAAASRSRPGRRARRRGARARSRAAPPAHRARDRSACRRRRPRSPSGSRHGRSPAQRVQHASPMLKSGGTCQRKARMQAGVDVVVGRHRPSLRRRRMRAVGELPGAAEAVQRAAGDAADAPVRHHRRAHAFVEADRVGVPVEHAPLEAAVAARRREPPEMREQRLADAATALLGLDEQVLEIEARPGEKGREVGEEEREGDDPAFALGDDRLGDRARAEQVRVQLLRRRLDEMGEVLEVGELADEADDRPAGRAARRRAACTKKDRPCADCRRRRLVRRFVR